MDYWNNEQPVVIDTGSNVLRYYKEAEKLQVSLPSWIDREGELRQGKTVAIDVVALKGSAKAVDLLKEILE